MCGILCLVSNTNKSTCLQKLYNECQTQIHRRGPDYYKSDEIIEHDIRIQMSASVLWLQGEFLVEQPINTKESIFCYNGDVFGGNAISTEERLANGDTKLFLNCLENSRIDNIVPSSLLHDIHGPYAFIYYNKIDSSILFGRDIFGRRSLLIAADRENNAYLITSVAVQTNIPMIEVPAIGIFQFNLHFSLQLRYEWAKRHKNFNEKFASIVQLFPTHVPYSNKIECEGSLSKKEKPGIKDLINVFAELKSKTPEAAFNHLLGNDHWKNNILQLNSKLEKALESRIATQPKYCKNCIHTKVHCNHCRVGILFSGGLDCTILALLADKYIEKNLPIDLLNVGFRPDTPDRQTGLQSLEELQRLRPERHWNFVSINVSNAELLEQRTKHIAHLIFPLNTVLDESLGCALWFAARGKSSIYESPCRVLLVGMGADELFGGYTRHRAAMQKRGIPGLQEALAEDWANIAHRNLGRDDRVVADHGRQLRTPYLDEEVVAFVQGLEVWEKTYPVQELPRGLGEKILLRTLAYYLGLRRAAMFEKRALQFGARIASKKENAHEVSPRLKFSA